jgi:hypothetical protein
MKDDNVPIVIKMKRLFTMGCAWEVDESLTTLGTIIAWDFVIAIDYPTNDMLMSAHIQLTRALNLKYLWRLIVSMLTSSNYFLFNLFVWNSKIVRWIPFSLVPET